MDPAPVTSSPDTRTFAFPRKFRWMMIGCALGFGGFTIFGVFLPILEPGDGIWFASAMCVAVFGGFMAMTIPVLFSLWDQARVSPDGISFSTRATRSNSCGGTMSVSYARGMACSDWRYSTRRGAEG